MSTRVYVDAALGTGARLVLAEDSAHHVGRVLRARVGDPLMLFNGRGGEYVATLTRLGRREAEVEVGTHQPRERESPLRITLAQGISRGERMDYTIQKAVELGVAVIQPLTTARSTVRLDTQRARRRQQHWQGIIIGACEQCGRNRLPELRPVCGLDEWLHKRVARDQPGMRLLLHGEAENGPYDLLRPAGMTLSLLVGPEGGLSPTEITQATDAGHYGLRLGPRVLRTETAALTALALLQGRWGDFC